MSPNEQRQVRGTKICLDREPADEAALKGCFSCHEPAKARDFVFTRYAP